MSSTKLPLRRRRRLRRQLRRTTRCLQRHQQDVLRQSVHVQQRQMHFGAVGLRRRRRLRRRIRWTRHARLRSAQSNCFRLEPRRFVPRSISHVDVKLVIIDWLVSVQLYCDEQCKELRESIEKSFMLMCNELLKQCIIEFLPEIQSLFFDRRVDKPGNLLYQYICGHSWRVRDATRCKTNKPFG